MQIWLDTLFLLMNILIFIIFITLIKLLTFFKLVLCKIYSTKNLNEVKIKATFPIANFQPPEQNGFVEITDNRVWFEDVYDCVYFNGFVRENIERNINRRIIVNGQADSGWCFRQLNHITIEISSDKLKVYR